MKFECFSKTTQTHTIPAILRQDRKTSLQTVFVKGFHVILSPTAGSAFFAQIYLTELALPSVRITPPGYLSCTEKPFEPLSFFHLSKNFFHHVHVSYIHIDSIYKPLLTSVGSGGPQLFMREFIMLLRVFSSIINVPQFESVILLIKSGKTKKGTYKHHRSSTLISVCEYI